MSSVTRSARLLELQALNALQKLELQKLNKAVARRNKRITGLKNALSDLRAEVFAATCTEMLEDIAKEERRGDGHPLGEHKEVEVAAALMLAGV